MASLSKKRRASQRARSPKTLTQFQAKSHRSQQALENVAHVLTRMRTGDVSLKLAAAEYGVAPTTVTRLAHSALRRRANGRYAVRASDRLLRVLSIPTHGGLQEVGVGDSRTAAQVGKYWTAVHEFLETGDATGLRAYRGKTVVDASGQRVPFLTDLDELERLGSAGVLSFESIYAKAG